MPSIDSNGLPVISDNAKRYKQLHDDAVRGHHSTVFGGIGARIGWRHGRNLLGSGLQHFKSKYNNNGFLSGIGNRIGSVGDYLTDTDYKRSNKQRLIQLLTDTGFSTVGLVAGARFGNNVSAPMQLSLEEGLGSGTSSRNIQNTYDRLFGSLSKEQQKRALDRIAKYNASVYGTDRVHSGLNKLINISSGIVGGEAGDWASRRFIEAAGLKDNNTLTGKALKGSLITAGNLLGAKVGINASNNAYRNLHGDALSPIPYDYYKPTADNINIPANLGRHINDALNTVIPGRVFSNPSSVALVDGKSVRDMHREHMKEVNKNKAKYNRGIGKYINPVSKWLEYNISRPIDTLMGQDTDLNPYN